MSNFIFDQFLNGNPDLNTSTVYAHLVHTTPSPEYLYTSLIDYCKDPAYLPKPVVGTLIPTVSIPGQSKWEVDPIDFGRVNYSKTIVGVVFVLQIGATPNPLVDLNYAYFEIVNEFGNPTPVRPGTQEIIFTIRSNSNAIVDNIAYRYSVGNFDRAPYFADLVMMVLTYANSGDPMVGPAPSQNSADQNFYAPLNGHVFKEKTQLAVADQGKQAFNDLNNPLSTVAVNGVIIKDVIVPLYSYMSAAYFNGASNLTYTGYNDFSVEADITGQPTKRTVISFAFYPELEDTAQTLLDLGTWSIVINADNTVSLRRGATAIATSLNLVVQDAWNFISVYQSAQAVFTLTLNYRGVQTAAAQTTLNTTALIVGPVFSGWLALLSKHTGTDALLGVTNAYPQTAPWNCKYQDYWNLTTDITSTVLTGPSVFLENTALLIKSPAARYHPRTTNTSPINGATANINNLGTSWFYDFGKGKAAIGNVVLLFKNPSNLPTCRNLGVDDTVLGNHGKLTLEIWATDRLPNNTPNSQTLADPDLWDVITVETLLDGDELDLALTKRSGIYRYANCRTAITRYYRFYRIGFANSINPAMAIGADFLGILLFNSTVIYPAQNIIPPDQDYIPTSAI